MRGSGVQFPPPAPFIFKEPAVALPSAASSLRRSESSTRLADGKVFQFLEADIAGQFGGVAFHHVADPEVAKKSQHVCTVGVVAGPAGLEKELFGLGDLDRHFPARQGLLLHFGKRAKAPEPLRRTSRKDEAAQKNSDILQRQSPRILCLFLCCIYFTQI